MSFSRFEYIGPVARAYRRVLESEEGMDNAGGSRMDDSERKLFYLDEIKRLENTLAHYKKQRRYVNGQGYAISGIKRTIDKYKSEVERIDREEKRIKSEKAKVQMQSQSQPRQTAPQNQSKQVDNKVAYTDRKTPDYPENL